MTTATTMPRPTLTVKGYMSIKPAEVSRELGNTNVRAIDYNAFYNHPKVVEAGIVMSMDDYMEGSFAKWLRANRNAIHLYAADRENFFMHVGVREAEGAQKPYLYAEDLS